MTENILRNPTYPECTANCPICGADLVTLDNECICKNKECGWSCQGCTEKDDI